MAATLQDLSTQIAQCMAADRHRLMRELKSVQAATRAGKPADQSFARLAQRVEASVQRRAQRLKNLPAPQFPEELPVNARRDEIAAAIRDHQVVIVSGETGSGKTTQLPKICLELQRGVTGLIGHTQPRRIAARTVAARIAQELKSPLGHSVGYKVRFADKLSGDTYIKLMTDGILLAETQGDRYLEAYDTLIIDEAHERSLNIDFLLGFIKQLLPRRPDLKVIITSATIDAERFSRHFDGAPVIEVSGRMYPVETRYRPLGTDDEDDREQDMEEAVVDAVDELSRLGPGDILVFLPGEREIRDTAEQLRKHHPPGAEILPLYARLSAAEQERVFKPGGARRIVLATNVAETSLTVPGIRYVIDTGVARIARYSHRVKVQQLQVEKISRASADQRKGRCGRVAAGVCVRLYAEDDYAARPEFTDPEILRSSLASVILRMKALRLGDVEDFPFVEPPSSRMIADGYQQLHELGAVDEARGLTPVGEQLARFPIDPKIARMILAAKEENCLTEALVIASALSVQDPRSRPMERADAADNAHRKFHDERSDFLAYLKLWEYFEEALKHKKSNRKLVADCHENFLSYLRMREWRDIHGQLQALVTELGLRPNEVAAGYDEVHRAMLAGLLGNIGFKQEEGDTYLGARQSKFFIFPGSALRKKQPKWVVAAELVETTRLYARTVAKIEPEWLEKVGAHLVKRTYFDPHWEKKSGQVSAYERVTLHGLTIVSRRRVHYATVNPKEARDIFIRSALVAGDFDSPGEFLRHNRRLIAEVEELEHKARRQDVLVDEQQLYAFFDERIPASVVGGASFERWRRDAERDNPKLLFLLREDLMRRGADELGRNLFPEKFQVDGLPLKLTYRFDPGAPNDGVTATVPLQLLNQLAPERFQWLVPGLLRDKVTALIKGLPQGLRRLVVPVPETVTAVMSERGFEQAQADGQDFLRALSAALKRVRQLDVAPEDWDVAKLPAHLSMNFRVIDEAGAELASGRDLLKLRAQLGQAAQLTFAESDSGVERDHVTRWDFGDLPEELSFQRNGRKLTGYPALTDEGADCSIRLFDTLEAAAASHRAGVRRLLRLELKEQVKQLEKSLPGTQLALQLRTIANADDLRDDMLAAITDRAFIGEDELPRNEKAFTAQKQRARTRLPAVTEALIRIAQAIAAEYQPLAARLNDARHLGRLIPELKDQLSRLVYKGCFSQTPWERLQHVPRYVKAMRLRIEKYPPSMERDARHAASVAQLWQQYEQRRDKHRKSGISDAQLEEFRWQIEELRVSLFAQELKTPYPVSVKRLQKLWESVKP